MAHDNVKVWKNVYHGFASLVKFYCLVIWSIAIAPYYCDFGLAFDVLSVQATQGWFYPLH